MRGRKVLLLIDNCPAHPQTENFTNLNVAFLPPNTTSILQSMNQWVIRNDEIIFQDFKQKERPFHSPSNERSSLIMGCCHTNVIISTYFMKAGVTKSSQQISETDADYPFKYLVEDLQNHLQEMDPSTIQK